MKKILWLCNTMMPEIAIKLGRKNFKESWLVGISDQLRKENEYELNVMFPQDKSKNLRGIRLNNITYYGFYKNDITTTIYNKEVVNSMQNIVNIVKPDLIHIFGTECIHTYEMLHVKFNPERIVISIQGLASVCARSYLTGISFKDIIMKYYSGNKLSSIYDSYKDFKKRGQYEVKSIKMALNVIGRTDWDYACVKRLNKNCSYYKCNETLRAGFYLNNWDINKIQRHAIFLGDGSYPIKGFHIFIKALPIILRAYEKTHVYVACDKSFIEMNTPYGQFINKEMKKYGVENRITFLGYQTEERMIQNFLKAHVYVNASLIENSSNAIGEGMTLGMPIVASYTGGTPSILKHEESGLLYQADAEYMLAHNICKIFDDDSLASKLSRNAKARAGELYDSVNNLKDLLKVYNKIVQN